MPLLFWRPFLMLTLIGALLAPPAFSTPIPDFPSKKTIVRLNGADDFTHKIGAKGSRGWELDYKRDRPGYALKGTKDPILLEPGIYRATFVLRRGNYPSKGLLRKTYGLFRIELWDKTTNEKINHRDLQIADFPKPNVYEPRWLEFSMDSRKGHIIEPRVYWIGLANGEVSHVQIDRFKNVSLRDLESKAMTLGQQLENKHLENGFVVSRKPDGSPDEIGDATTYTGFYIASLAWKYGVTQDAMTYQALENAIETLHKTIKGTEDSPYLTRFVEEDGTPLPKSPSKDVYTSFFLAYSIALPFIKNEALKKQMKDDMEKVASRFLQDDLTVKFNDQIVMILTPYYTESEIKKGINKLFTKKDGGKKILKGLQTAKRLLPFTELWPGMKKTIRALKKKNADLLFAQVVPTMNGAADLAERVRNVLREQYRQDLFPKRFRNQDYPGKKLEQLITASLKKLPQKKKISLTPDRRFDRLSDLRILASNALISLHIIRSADVRTQKEQFNTYYRNNLYSQEALLKCAVDWYGLEENFVKETSGNPAADRLRKGYLSLLSLYNLIELETNPAIKKTYQDILNRWWKDYQNEGNPMARAIVAKALSPRHPHESGDDDIGLILKALDQYPINRKGFGPAYWKQHGAKIGNELGGGVYKRYAREPLPISHRPKDSFLWQRNARRLKGDYLKNYPATDYLFVYWFCRYHKLIPPTPKEPSVNLK